jgi:hypothetical protein
MKKLIGEPVVANNYFNRTRQKRRPSECRGAKEPDEADRTFRGTDLLKV